jgi:hypothetical protein
VATAFVVPAVDAEAFGANLMPLNAILYRAISEGFRRNIRAIEAYDTQLQAEMGVPKNFDVNKVTDAEIERMLGMVHKADEESPCVVCLLEAISPTGSM